MRKFSINLVVTICVSAFICAFGSFFIANAAPPSNSFRSLGIAYDEEIHAVLIGIDGYTDTQFQGCTNDVIDLSDKLVREGVPKRNIHQLIGKNATLEHIKAAIDSVARTANPDDIFLLTFSGFSIADPGETCADSVSLVLAHGLTRTRNTDPTVLLPIPLLAEWMSQVQCTQQYIFSEAGPGVSFKNAMLASLFETDPLISSASDRRRIIATTVKAGIEYRDSTGHYNGLMFHILLRMPNLSLTLWHSKLQREFESELETEERKWRLENSSIMSEESNYCHVYDERDYRSLFLMLRPASRGFEEDAPAEIQPTGSHRKIALLVGTNRYENKAWSRLRNPLNDTRAIGAVLRDKFGYELDTLYNQKRDSILSEFCRLKATLDSTDEVIIVFSGHGYFNTQTSCGHIIPVDGASPDVDKYSNSSYLHWNDLKNIIDTWKAKNVFVIVDVCFGGKFDQVAPDLVINDYKTMMKDITAKEFHDRKAKYTSRIFLAAGSVPVPDYWNESMFHSPFANKLLEALNNSNSFITPSMLFQQMQLNVTEPVLRSFGNHDKVNGEFVLVPVKK